jgi:hypothetical protein
MNYPGRPQAFSNACGGPGEFVSVDYQKTGNSSIVHRWDVYNLTVYALLIHRFDF